MVKLTRKRHKNSKTGCSLCKQRRIKCGEEKPACRNCLVHKLHCPFLLMTPDELEELERRKFENGMVTPQAGVAKPRPVPRPRAATAPVVPTLPLMTPFDPNLMAPELLYAPTPQLPLLLGVLLPLMDVFVASSLTSLVQSVDKFSTPWPDSWQPPPPCATFSPVSHFNCPNCHHQITPPATWNAQN